MPHSRAGAKSPRHLQGPRLRDGQSRVCSARTKCPALSGMKKELPLPTNGWQRDIIKNRTFMVWFPSFYGTESLKCWAGLLPGRSCPSLWTVTVGSLVPPRLSRPILQGLCSKQPYHAIDQRSPSAWLLTLARCLSHTLGLGAPIWKKKTRLSKPQRSPEAKTWEHRPEKGEGNPAILRVP